jgi:lysosomal acid lipase/cholesteryl ester hydrolase
MKHWKQMLDSGKFQAYDYGSARDNEAHYGQAYPPSWDLGQIRVPMRLIAGDSDELADLTDVNFLWDSLKPEVKTFLRVYSAGHCTFMWGINVAPWMNDVKSMLKA